MLRSVVFAIALLAVLPEALAFCSEPSAPSAPWSSPPSAPFCGNFGDLSGCDQWEVDRYRNEVEDFIDEMQSYADDAAVFADEALAFAQCMADDAVREWNQFVGR